MDEMTELGRRVLGFMDEPGSDSFDELALAIFRFQLRGSSDYARLVADRGVGAGDVRRWQDVPAAPTVAFKSLRFCCGPSRIVFRTSGTTGGAARRGEHHLADTRLYRESLRRSFRQYVLPDGASLRLLILAPSPGWAPDSSLGFMMQDLLEQHGAPGSGFFVTPDGLQLEPLVQALESAAADGVPVGLLGTAFAFVHLLDALASADRRIQLPPGSRIMDTGGFKGRSRVVARAELLGGYAARLGIPPRMVVNEYGMTEMSSQFYDASLLGGDPEVKRGPHWVRTLVIDPVTGAELPPGATGLLRHIDLANVDSVIAVETEDLGATRGEGFVLLGRAEDAEPRGCSLPLEEGPSTWP